MKPKPPKRRQATSPELRDAIMDFIRRKFYPEQAVSFAKDTPRLLKWVVFKLAVYLDSRAVSISTERYEEIMIGEKGILMEALRFGDTGNITYLPAYLLKVVQSHLAVHGEGYYEEGKALRGAVEGALAMARGGLQGREPDAVRDFAAASRLLRPKKRAVKVPGNDQLTML